MLNKRSRARESQEHGRRGRALPTVTRMYAAGAHERLREMAALSSSSSRLTHLSSSHSQNPVSLRLYKVLSANFDDEATKQALDTLAELYAPPSRPSGKKATAAKADAELDGEQDEPELSDCDALSTSVRLGASAAVHEELVSTDVAARARKNLRRDVESKLAESSRQFLKAFGEVDKVSA